jgi:hypothetical protein
VKKISTFLLLIGICSSASAAFNGLTVHSRANCVNNESIAWDWTHWNLNTVGSHYYNDKLKHSEGTGWNYTWRNGIVHWGEGRGGWKVHGQHYIAYKAGDLISLGEQWVTDCSIYNGWWDRNK